MSHSIDHRSLADEMEIYFLNENIGAGLPVWLPNGVAIRDSLESYIKELERRAGFQRIVSPHLARPALYEKSGHLKFYEQDMFPKMFNEEDEVGFYLKPMNCPHHHLAFASAPRSYRQLPLRLAEYGQVYRFEKSGSLRGLSRVRGLCQNDAHIYVEPENAKDEMRSVLRMHEECYRALGLKEYRYRLSLRDPESDEFEGDESLWRRCEDVLRQALIEEGLSFFEAIGEAAFYGPKIDVQMQIASGSEESVASAQLDALSAEKFDLSYVDRQGNNVRPWIIHRAPLGSHERFVSVLLEHFNGQLPGWLSPIQAVFIPMSEADAEHCHDVAQGFLAAGLRVKVDHSVGSLAKRIKFARRERPFARVVIGESERRNEAVVAELRSGEIQGSQEEVIEQLKALCKLPL